MPTDEELGDTCTEVTVAVEVEFDELLVCDPPAPFEPQPVSIARISNRPVQDTDFMSISNRKVCGGIDRGEYESDIT